MNVSVYRTFLVLYGLSPSYVKSLSYSKAYNLYRRKVYKVLKESGDISTNASELRSVVGIRTFIMRQSSRRKLPIKKLGKELKKEKLKMEKKAKEEIEFREFLRSESP